MGASLEALPTAAWLQIMITTCMMETGYFLFEAQTADKEAGDIGGESWVRYDDPETKTFKLNVERQNGRAAMLGICLRPRPGGHKYILWSHFLVSWRVAYHLLEC